MFQTILHHIKTVAFLPSFWFVVTIMNVLGLLSAVFRFDLLDIALNILMLAISVVCYFLTTARKKVGG
jgi:hypothetical protein